MSGVTEKSARPARRTSVYSSINPDEGSLQYRMCQCTVVCYSACDLERTRSRSEDTHRKGSSRSRCSKGLHLTRRNTSSKRGSTLMRCCFASSKENVSTAGTNSCPSAVVTGATAAAGGAGLGGATDVSTAAFAVAEDPLVARAFFLAGSLAGVALGAVVFLLLTLFVLVTVVLVSTTAAAVLPVATACAVALRVTERVTRCMVTLLSALVIGGLL